MITRYLVRHQYGTVSCLAGLPTVGELRRRLYRPQSQPRSVWLGEQNGSYYEIKAGQTIRL